MLLMKLIPSSSEVGQKADSLYVPKLGCCTGVLAVHGPQHRQLRERGRCEDNPDRRHRLGAPPERDRERGLHAEELLQVAEEPESGERHAPAPSRRSDSDHAEGHMRQTERALQHTRCRSRRRYVQFGQKLQRQRGQRDYFGAHHRTRDGTQVSPLITGETGRGFLRERCHPQKVNVNTAGLTAQSCL